MSFEFSKKNYFFAYIIFSTILLILSVGFEKVAVASNVLLIIELVFFITFFFYSGLKMKEKDFDSKKVASFSAFTAGMTALVIEIISFVILKEYNQPTLKNVKISYNEYLISLVIALIVAIVFDILVAILFSYLGTKLYKPKTNQTDI